MTKIIVTEKSCPRCWKTKTAADYYANKSTKDRLSAYCRTCTKDVIRRQALSRKRAACRDWALVSHKRCATCLMAVPIGGFAKIGRSRDGLANRCKVCVSKSLFSRRYSVTEKECSTCKAVKPASEFPRSKWTPNGLCSICRKCTSSRQARLRHQSELERMAEGLVKRCMVCQVEKSLNAFRYSKHSPDNRTWRCKDCYNKAGEDVAEKGLPHVPSKYCPTCQIVKDATEFRTKKGSGDGLAHECRECTYKRSKPQHSAAYQKRKAYLGPRNREYYLQRTFGISHAQYESMLEAQNGGCAICGVAPGKRRLSVDHDHVTGLIRGLLCHIHNTALGIFNDDVAMMRRAIDYVLRPPGESAAYRVPLAALEPESLANSPLA